MTRVVFPFTESEASTSTRAPTPPSDNDGRGRSLAPSETAFSFRCSSPFSTDVRDTANELVIPSVERDTDSSEPVATPSATTRSSVTPSLAFTPPPSDSQGSNGIESTRYFPAMAGRSEGADSINEALQALDLSSRPGMPQNQAQGNTHRRTRSSTTATSQADPVFTPATTQAADDNALGMGEIADALRDVAKAPANTERYLQLQDLRAQSEPLQPRRRSRSRSASHARHEVHQEELPRERFHEPAFQAAFADTKRLMADIGGVLSSSSLHHEPDSVMKRLYQETCQLSKFQCPATRTVGFVGDSGVGKSSLLNSLLDVKDLARTSNSGAACTCVVTEYHYHDSDDFGIKVDWFTIDALKSQITELLKSYRHFHLKHDMGREEREDFEERANVAVDTFHAMFRSLMESEDFLFEWPEQDALGTLFRWLDEVHPGLDDMPGALSSGQRLSNIAECSSLLMKLTSEQGSSAEPVLWPFIKKIKVHLNAHILSKGLILVDLPGLRDLNSARLKITERYILECHEIFAICNIGRATTDVGVKTVFDLALKAKLSNVGIICTKSDDIRAEEACKDWRGVKGNRVKQLMDVVDRDRRQYKEIEEDLKDFDDEDWLPGEQEAHHHLLIRLRNVKKSMENHEIELKTFLINTRNGDVVAQLRRTYQSKVVGADLSIFCVSNTLYWENRNLEKDKALVCLQLSGIMGVRKHCISIVAESQLRAATRYMKEDIPAHLGAVQLWVQSGAGSESAEQKEAIRETLDQVERTLKRELTGPASESTKLRRAMRHLFRDSITRGQRCSQWGRSANAACKIWSNWAPQSYIAFCRKFGDHHTKTAGAHCWNEEATVDLVSDSVNTWEVLRNGLQVIENNNISAAESALRHCLRLLDDTITRCGESVEVLSTTLHHKESLLLAALEEAFEEFEGHLRTLRTDAFSGIRSSIIGQLMEPAYLACQVERGGGSDGRRHNIIESKLGSESFFVDHHTEFRKEFNIMVDDLNTKVQDCIATHMLAVTQVLDMLRDENVALESEKDPEFRRRVEEESRRAQQSLESILHVVG